MSQAAEFEFVLGPRQFASLGLVVLTALGIFTGAAYMAGKSSAKVVEVRVPLITPAAEPIQSAPASAKQTPESEPQPEIPLEGLPEPDRIYIQLGSLDRGFATLVVQGARKMGVPAFVAPGVSPAVFRAIAGPFTDEKEMGKARAMFDAMGLKTFARKYPEFKSSLHTPALVP